MLRKRNIREREGERNKDKVRVARQAGVTEPLLPRCIFYHPVADEPLDSCSSLRDERGGREGGRMDSGS